MSASSKPSAVRTLLPARSRGIWTKMLATWPARMPQLQNTWRPVAVGRKSRCYSPISSGSAPHALAPQGSEWRKRRVPACRDRPKPETTRPLKTSQHASGNAGHITPPSAAEEPPKTLAYPSRNPTRFPQNEYLTAFSTISAHCGRTRRLGPACRNGCACLEVGSRGPLAAPEGPDPTLGIKVRQATSYRSPSAPPVCWPARADP